VCNPPIKGITKLLCNWGKPGKNRRFDLQFRSLIAQILETGLPGGIVPFRVIKRMDRLG
jgi:hypothetical protein